MKRFRDDGPRHTERERVRRDQEAQAWVDELMLREAEQETFWGEGLDPRKRIDGGMTAVGKRLERLGVGLVYGMVALTGLWFLQWSLSGLIGWWVG